MKSSSSTRLLLLGLMLIGLFLRVGAAIKFPTIDHPDEIFQTQEPAHRLAYGYGIVSWEWRKGARSWVFPGFLAGVMRATDWLAAGSQGYQWGITVVLSLISLTTIWFGYAWAKRASGTEAAFIAAGACAIWYELVYFAPKTLTEVVATHALLPGLYLGVYGDRLGEKKRMFLAGIFCGLAMSLRIHLAPAVGFAVLWFCYPNWRKRTLPLAAGLLLPVIGFGLVDAVTWSHPFESMLVYFHAHTRDFKVPSLPGTEITGARPRVQTWRMYLKILSEHLGPVAFFVLMGVRRSRFLGWMALIILAVHSMFGYWEVRYLYPLMPLEITLAALGIMELAPVLKSWWKPLTSRMIVAGGLAFIGLCSCLLLSQFDWSQRSGSLAAFDQLSLDPTLCGVAIYKVGWWNLAGYAHLHQNVPILILLRGSDVPAQSTSFNAVVSRGLLNGPTGGFEATACWNNVCLYRRPGACTPPVANNEINSLLESVGK